MQLLEACDELHGATALVWTGWYHQHVSASAILELGASVDASDKYGQQFFDYASGRSPHLAGDAATQSAFECWDAAGRPVLQWDRSACCIDALSALRRRRTVAGPLEWEARSAGARCALAVAQWWSCTMGGGPPLPAPALCLLAHALMPSMLCVSVDSSQARTCWTPVSRPRVPEVFLGRVYHPAAVLRTHA